jgi:hypothetical protein
MGNFIIEGAIYQEAQVLKAEPNKAIFKMTMQTADEVNQNRRMYPKAVLNEAMQNCEERMKRRAMIGELDHPVPSGNDTFDSIRQTTVLLKEVSHIIRSYEWNGNRLVGELETSSSNHGKTLLSHLRDRVGLGLSMRGMAELNRQNNVNIVKSPLMIITFDAVSLPSHKAAIVDFNEMKFEARMLTENCGTICTPDGICYISSYFDKLVETKIIQFYKRWV